MTKLKQMDNKMNNNMSSKDDDAMIRHLMQASKKEAPENLKYRIMNQIETEAALTRKQQPAAKPSTNPLRNFWAVFGIMYIVIILLSAHAYFTKGADYLLSGPFIGTIALISGVFSLFWLTTKVDEWYRDRKKG